MYQYVVVVDDVCASCSVLRFVRVLVYSYRLAHPPLFCHLLANDRPCAGNADRNGCPKIICAGEIPPARGVLRYSRSPRWKFSSSRSPFTVVVAISFFRCFYRTNTPAFYELFKLMRSELMTTIGPALRAPQMLVYIHRWYGDM